PPAPVQPPGAAHAAAGDGIAAALLQAELEAIFAVNLSGAAIAAGNDGPAGQIGHDHPRVIALSKGSAAHQHAAQNGDDQTKILNNAPHMFPLCWRDTMNLWTHKAKGSRSSDRLPQQ